MNINIYLINTDGSGSLIQATTAINDADALAKISALMSANNNSYRVEEILANGSRIIGQVP